VSVPPPKPSQIAPGYRLDRYEMLCPIAEGGMASVWVARLRGKRGFEKLVAIKTILPKFAQDARFERMFLDEAGLAARIEHANVAQVLDLGEEHDVLYLAMELIDGDSLSKLLRVVQKKDLSIPTGIALRILADTCGGLHAAHELRGKDGESMGVVHRDVSPQNILVTMNGIAKLIDFGIAKARDRVSEDTSEGMLKGKIHYMAPEQALGRPVDRRADIWAVGAILYFLLAGRPAFEGENHLATLHLLSAGRPPLPLPSTVPATVSAIVGRALTHDPEKRFETAAEMQAALETAMVEANLVTTTTTVATFVQEHMAERAKKRREGLDLALSAAAQREKVARMLEKAGSDSASGHGVSDGSERAPVVEATYATVLLGSAAPHIGEGGGPPPSQSTPGHAESSSSATLGAALASPVPPPGVPRGFGWRSATLAGATLLAIGVAAGLVVRPNGLWPLGVTSHAVAAAPTAPPPPAATPLPSSIPPPPPTASAEAPASSASARAAPSASTTSAPTPKAAPKPWKPSTAPAAPSKHRVNDGF
jgi:eukaryotic-like serine/threonine-protein kinase